MLSKEKERILVNLPKIKIKEIEDLANKKGVSRNDIIVMAIYNYLMREEHIENIYKEKLKKDPK